MHVKLSAATSRGELTVIESRIEPAEGPPLHVHERENETYYVLDGSFEFVCGDDRVLASTGSFVFAPRGVPHRYRNIGREAGKLLFCFTPGGIERFFIAAANEPDASRRAEIARTFGIRMLGMKPP